MSFYTYPALRSSVDSHALAEGPSDSASGLSLSLSDIIDIPDEEPETAQTGIQTTPATCPHPPRANAMSLGFILSEQVPSEPFYGIRNTVTSPLGTPLRPLAQEPGMCSEDAGESNIRGWAPLDPNHYTLVDNLKLPGVLPSAPPGFLLSAEHTGASRASVLSCTLNARPLATQVNIISPVNMLAQVSAENGRPVASPFSAAGLPSAHSMHALAALSGVRRSLDSSAAPVSTTRHLVISTQSSRVPRPPQPQRSTSDPSPKIPPAPRGGVAPALARSVTYIRIAREQALQARTARPRKPVARGGEPPETDSDEPAPSVLGKWVSGRVPL